MRVVCCKQEVEKKEQVTMMKEEWMELGTGPDFT